MIINANCNSASCFYSAHACYSLSDIVSITQLTEVRSVALLKSDNDKYVVLSVKREKTLHLFVFELSEHQCYFVVAHSEYAVNTAPNNEQVLQGWIHKNGSRHFIESRERFKANHFKSLNGRSDCK